MDLWEWVKRMNHYNEEELLQIVAKRARKYTSNESTSITYETARQLMSSILYCMEETNKTERFFNEKNEAKELVYTGEKVSAIEAFEIGLNRKKEIINKAKKLYCKICSDFEDYENECYRDTVIDGMKAFFERYDVEYDATNHILTLDYPLLFENRKLKGIDLIYDYLLKISLEQKFLAGFDKEEILKILSSYHNEYEGLIINLARLVLRNALGCMIADVPYDCLSIDESSWNRIKQKCIKKSIKQLEELLLRTLAQLIYEKYDEDFILKKYLEKDIKDFAYELNLVLQNGNWTQLFITEKKREKIDKQVYEDGNQMEDEELRKLIVEMSDLPIKEKISMIKNRVRSLSDLKELLNICFYQEEYEKVFELLGTEEKNYLFEEINIKISFEEELNEWEKMFIRY